jgi:D-3-phosphoglycerate dehydrogenase
MGTVLITDDCAPLLWEGLARLGYACDYLPEITYDQTRERIGGYEGLIVNSKIRVDADFLALAPRLRFVGRLGSGMEIIDREACALRSVAVFSSPEGNRNAVAEQAMGMLLMLLNNLRHADAEVRNRIWRREANRGVEMGGKTVGIIGFGHTGAQLAGKLQGWGVRVLAHDKYLPSGYAAAFPWVEEVSLPALQAAADIISLHLPLREDTLFYVDAGFIQSCRPGFILVNTARGSCVHSSALLDALECGTVGGACLDVFENEKPGTWTAAESALYQRLYALPNTVLSPHIAGWTKESKRLLAAVLLERIVNWKTTFLINGE